MIRTSSALLAIAFASLAQAAPAPTGVSPTAIFLRVSAVADGPNVLVNDVLSAPLAGEEGWIALKPLGLPGSKVAVPRDLVQARLMRAKSGPYRVEGQAVEVQASKQIIPGELIQRFAREALTERLRSLSHGAKVIILDGGQMPRDLSAPDRSSKMELEASVGVPRGNVVMKVRISQDDARGKAVQVADIPVVFMVKVSQTVAVAIMPLKQGQLIKPEQIEQREMDTTYLRGAPFEGGQSPVGLKARAYIPQGKPVTTDLVELPPVVKRGDMVRLLVRSGGVSLETTAKALRDAALGESLPVEVEGRNKTVQGRAIGEGLVLKEAP